jgi:hypothetical protein
VPMGEVNMGSGFCYRCNRDTDKSDRDNTKKRQPLGYSVHFEGKDFRNA